MLKENLEKNIKKCAACGDEFVRLANNQIYCAACAQKRKKEMMSKYYQDHKQELNFQNKIWKRENSWKPSTDQVKTWQATTKLINQGELIEQNTCCLCGVSQDDKRLLNHHSAGYQGDFAARSILRVCYSCHKTLHNNLKRED